MTKTLACSLALAVLLPSAWAQFPPASPVDPNLPTVATPTAFPPPNTYPTTYSVTLLSATPGAEIHYTLDGTQPTASSPIFDPYKLLWVGAVNNGDAGLKTGYTIRAVAVKTGMNSSAVATFQYTIDRRDRTAYVSEDVLPGVTMIRDYANDKMFLLKGSKKALLIDSGMGTGDLKGFLTPYLAGLPLEVVFTHFHGDHTGQSYAFIASSVEHINDADRAQVVALLKNKGAADDAIGRNLQDIKEGDTLDLGDRKLTVYQVPGHTPGSIVVFEQATGYLFTGDSVGSNGPGIPDAFWLHMSSSPPVDEYLSTLEVFRSKVQGSVKYILSGHNDRPLEGEAYLDNLQSAAQSVVDRGEKALVPSWRPQGVWQALGGDRTRDPNWASINVNKEKCLSAAPDKIATLRNLQLGSGAPLDYAPSRSAYTAIVGETVTTIQITPTATAGSYRALKINGVEVKSGTPYDAAVKRGENSFSITVTAPDRVTTKTYTLIVTRAAR